MVVDRDVPTILSAHAVTMTVGMLAARRSRTNRNQARDSGVPRIREDVPTCWAPSPSQTMPSPDGPDRLPANPATLRCPSSNDRVAGFAHTVMFVQVVAPHVPLWRASRRLPSCVCDPTIATLPSISPPVPI